MKTRRSNTGLLLEYHSTVDDTEIYTYNGEFHKRVYIIRNGTERLMAKCESEEILCEAISELKGMIEYGC